MTEPNVPTPRQTLSYVRHLLQSRGLIPKNKMGQNFLIDLNLLDLIVQTADLNRKDAVLEVGSGTGSLTVRLSEKAGAVVSVELDADFYKMVTETVGWLSNASFLHADILERKNEMNPRVIAEWDRRFAEAGCNQRKLVANLPYAVATPVIGNLLISNISIERMVVMV